MSIETAMNAWQSLIDLIGPTAQIHITGGEPFLREDIVEICQAAVRYMKVPVIIIPTNGLLTEKGCRTAIDGAVDLLFHGIGGREES